MYGAQAHTDTHRHTQTHTDTHRHTQTQTKPDKVDASTHAFDSFNASARCWIATALPRHNNRFFFNGSVDNCVRRRENAGPGENMACVVCTTHRFTYCGSHATFCTAFFV